MKNRSKPGLEDIAPTPGVPQTTVSRVLRGAGVSQATCDKVLTKVARIGCLTNRLSAAFDPAAPSTPDRRLWTAIPTTTPGKVAAKALFSRLRGDPAPTGT